MSMDSASAASILVLGHLCADAIARPVNALPARGKLTPIEHLSLHTGGCATSTAIAIAKVGGDVAIAGKIGADGFGDFIYGTLTREGVDTRYLLRDARLPTSATVVTVDDSGERSFLHCYGANAQFCLEDIDLDALSGRKILHIASLYLLPALDGEPMARLLKTAKAQGIMTTLDTAWDPTGQWMSLARPVLEYVDLFVPSEDEAALIAGVNDVREMAKVFHDLGVPNVVIKRGAQGSFISVTGLQADIPPFKVTSVDTTGAGDSFVGGLLFGLWKGWDYPKAAAFGNALGAHSIMALGASEGIPDYNAVVAFMSAQGFEF